MKILINICSIIGTVITVLVCYKTILFFGIFKHKKYPKTNEKRTYAICVAARNEANVIANFLQSVKNLDYPQEKLKVFLCAHNCTDKTADIARTQAEMLGVNLCIFEHNNKHEKTKGFALKHLFDEIKAQELDSGIDGYFVFDADNILKTNYVDIMNNAFCAGNKIITSFRNSKNLSHNWISFSYAIHWLRTCLMEHRGTNLFNLSCRIQGCGFLFSKDVLESSKGWIYTSLTEDRAFCTDVVINGYKVAYCEEAEFFDEQPIDLKISLRQRLRWAKGHLQSAVQNCPKLINRMFKFDKNFMVYFNTFWINFPFDIESVTRKIITLACKISLAIISCKFWGVFSGLLITFAINTLVNWLSNMLVASFTFVYYRKRIKFTASFASLVFYIFMFPWFEIIGIWSMYIALFKKVEWKPIPHNHVVDIKDMN